MILVHWAFIFLRGSGMSCGDSSGGIVDVEEGEVALGRGSEILTLDLDFLGEGG